MFDEERYSVEGPRLHVASAKGSDNGWRAAGTVTFEVRRGREIVSELRFEFTNAASEADAMRQARQRLAIVAQALLRSAQADQ
jgi:hypothetical protein